MPTNYRTPPSGIKAQVISTAAYGTVVTVPKSHSLIRHNGELVMVRKVDLCWFVDGRLVYGDRKR